MIKKIIIPLVALAIVVGIVQAKQLWEYGSFQERAEKAVDCGIVLSVNEYTGSIDQNLPLLECYKEQKEFNGEYLQVLENPWSQREIEIGWGDPMFGATTGMRPSDFKTTLAESLSASASTTEEIDLSSVTTKDDHTLTTADIGDFMCFKINPNASNRELVCCTGGISGTTLQDCTRGYNFYDGSTTAANCKSHSPGETVIISNDDVWLMTQYPGIVDDETITGAWTFSTSTIASTKLYLGPDGAYIWYDSDSQSIGFASSTAGTEVAFATGGTTFTAIPPISLSGGELKLNTTTNHFELSGSNLQLRLNNSLTANASGLAVATSGVDFTWDNNTIFSGSVTSTGHFDVAEICFDGGDCRTTQATSTGGVMASTTTQTISASANYDHYFQLAPLSFYPQRIEITIPTIYLPDAGSGQNAFWSTTMTFYNRVFKHANGWRRHTTADVAQITLESLDFYATSTGPIIWSEIGTGGWSIEMSIPEASSTGFIVRLGTVKTGSPNNVGKYDLVWQAFSH